LERDEALVDLGGIDCDIHPAVNSTADLVPYLSGYWREMIPMRTMNSLDLASYPPGSALAGRADWRSANGRAGVELDKVQREALDAFGTKFAICNVLYGGPVLYSEDMAAAVCSATNDWLADQWLSKDDRLRGSIVVPVESPELAVAEIERLAGDPRFVQVMVLCMGEMPLGKRYYWPIWEAAEKHGLPIGIHAGSSFRHPPSTIGYGSFLLEDYVAQSQTFGAQVASFVTEGVFEKYPGLKVVLIESGFTWLPSFLWRLDKTWRGLRAEVPWLKRRPFEIVRDHFRLTLQPVDAPDTGNQLERVIDQLGSDEMLLFSTDYPHHQFDGDAAMPSSIPASLARKILVDNPMATYTRLQERKA
jgi:predicted TIM-barrel fold metal-dependent hydrolase